jgi:thiol-disulfide isomerase/thioredoxin
MTGRTIQIPRASWLCCVLLCASMCGCGSDAGIAPVASDDASASRLVPLEGRIDFVEGFRHGWEVANSQGKPILVLFTAEWCNYCHALASEALSEPSVVKLAGQFTCVMVDADSEPDVCRQFRVRGYPTIQFLSPRGLPLNRLTGKQPAGQLASEMEAALQAVARRVDEPTSPRRL